VAYSISLAPAAVRQFRKLLILIQQRLKPHIDSLAADPRPPGTKKLEAEAHLYRVRVGDYRIVYYIWDGEREVVVVKIAHRREVYR
jgi:mRNA interferase RelE/StbE